MTLLLQEGGSKGKDNQDATVGHTLLLYHGLPKSILVSSGSGASGTTMGREQNLVVQTIKIPIKTYTRMNKMGICEIKPYFKAP